MDSRNVVVDETTTTTTGLTYAVDATSAFSSSSSSSSSNQINKNNNALNHQYETICKSLRQQHSNDIIESNRKLISTRIGSRNYVSNNNNNNYEMPSMMTMNQGDSNIVHWKCTEMDNKKPPILPPTKRSSVINLDKNRIRYGRRSILPRPLSLPNSFNLIKSFKMHEEPKDITTVDISVIKELEDEIYKRKEEILQQNKEFVLKKGCSNKNCTNCNNLPNFIPNQVIERKTIDLNETSAMRSPNSQPVLFLDTWQMEPLLMKYDKVSDSSQPNPNSTSNEKKSILIVDNSSYYPTLIKYEINANTPKQPSLLLAVSATTASEHLDSVNIKNSNAKQMISESGHVAGNKNFAQQLFERCLGKSTDQDYASLSASDNPVDKTSNEIDSKNVPTKKLSKFKRFILQRRSLNLSTSKRCVAVAADDTFTRVPPVNSGYYESSASDIDDEHLTLTNHTVNAAVADDKSKFICNNYDDGVTAAASTTVPSPQQPPPPSIHGIKSKLKSNKLKLLVLMKKQRFRQCAGQTSNDTKLYLTKNSHHHKRKWKSVNDVNIVTNDANDHKSYNLIYQNAFPRISWSHMDIVDIFRSNFNLNNFNLISTNHPRLKSEFQISRRGDKSQYRHSSYGQQRSRQVKRRASFRQNKRHSVGSPTDVVKTWVYRRR